ncbi:MAG: hypothetical protein M0P91_04680 [Sulfuricurvum sp.]|jgi:hypothetical protein|uniref:hypothetical protein n=1 Tax=Sulfuricurvum sp. TaxID=2025608 RepID=UPI0025E7F51D|nr:hypothetical protein [Sulfuricurvum sp.]MCK9372471.1 hypothetical protein [Sulfuricurvum sp.]
MIFKRQIKINKLNNCRKSHKIDFIIFTEKKEYQKFLDDSFISESQIITKNEFHQSIEERLHKKNINDITFISFIENLTEKECKDKYFLLNYFIRTRACLTEAFTIYSLDNIIFEMVLKDKDKNIDSDEIDFNFYLSEEIDKQLLNFSDSF